MERVKELTSRQWKLYEYLKSKTDWVNIQDVIDDLPDLYYCKRVVRSDIQKLRASNVITLTIMNDFSYGYKIARTESEERNYFKKRYDRLTGELSLYNHEVKKSGQDGQMVIQFTGYEKDTINTILRKEVE